MKKLRILFVGNSHTYMNDLPEMVADKARGEGYDCEVTMIAHGGWYLDQHVAEPDVRFNIRYGHYDYVVIQEHAHPFGPEERFFAAARQLNEWIREAGSKMVVYMTWAKQDDEAVQPRMIRAHEEIARELDALLAPVGVHWWDYLKNHPDVYMYKRDGQHASSHGSGFASGFIWEAIREDAQQSCKEDFTN